MRVIVIGGGSGSGKTTLAYTVSEALGVENAPVLCVDRYYKSLTHLNHEELDKFNFDHPDAFDWPFFEEQIRQILNGETVSIPEYDYATHSRKDSYPITPSDYLIVEGIMALHHPFIRELAELKIFVDASEALRFERRKRRDVVERGRTPESVDAWWKERVQPMFEAHCAPLSCHADLVVSGADHVSDSLVQVFNFWRENNPSLFDEDSLQTA